MRIESHTCDNCVYEEILKEVPDYRMERVGNRPIWHKYEQRSKRKLCVVADDCFGEIESICFEHLFKEYYEDEDT